MEDIPTEQWSVTCIEEGVIQVKKIPVPTPAPGQVLVKCMAAPINPSDMGFLKGIYSEHGLFKIHYPSQPGWEGAGIVVQNGGGLAGILGWRVMGTRVAFTRTVHNNTEMIAGGTMQQYVLADAYACVPLPDSIPFDIGSMFFVNPITAFGLVDRIQLHGSAAAVQTAAFSQLGRMIIKLCKDRSIPLINIVRKDEQIRILQQQYGAEYVLNSTAEGFEEELKNLSKKLKAKTLLECIGGT